MPEDPPSICTSAQVHTHNDNPAATRSSRLPVILVNTCRRSVRAPGLQSSTSPTSSDASCSNKSGFLGYLNVPASPITPRSPLSAGNKRPSLIRRTVHRIVHSLATDEQRAIARSRELSRLKGQIRDNMLLCNQDLPSDAELTELAELSLRDITPNDFGTLTILDDYTPTTPSNMNPFSEQHVEGLLSNMRIKGLDELPASAVDDSCGICLDDFLASDAADPERGLVRIPGCGHVVHFSCMKRWVDTRRGKWVCPIDNLSPLPQL